MALVFSSKFTSTASCGSPVPPGRQSWSGRFGGTHECGTLVFRFRPLNFGRSTSVWLASCRLTNRSRPLFAKSVSDALHCGAVLLSIFEPGGNLMSKFVTRFGCLFFAVLVSSVDVVLNVVPVDFLGFFCW